MVALRRGTAISHDIDTEAAHDITAEAAHAKSIPKRRMASQPTWPASSKYSFGRSRVDTVMVVPSVRRTCVPYLWAVECAHSALSWDRPTPAKSAPGLGSSLPHLRRDWPHPCRICAGTGD